jgi:uncharacterized protein (TIGR02265 family)
MEPISLTAEEDLCQRLTQLTPSDVVRGLVINGVLEVVRQLEGEAAMRHCQEVCGEAQFLDFFNYPSSAFLRLLHTTARLLADRQGGFEGALRLIGHRSALNFAASLSGKAMVLMAQGNPVRLISSMPTGYKLLVGAGESEVHWLEPTCGVLTLQRDTPPRQYTESGIVTLCSVLRPKELTVRSWPVGPLSNAYEIRWAAGR